MAFPNDSSNDFTIFYHLAGVRTSCSNCGLHVHEGMNCRSNTGPHHWDSSRMSDPWNSRMGAVYNAYNEMARGHFHLNSGYNVYNNEGRTVTIHDQDGTRAGCGVLYRGMYNCG